jgi:hypothetical protein
MREDALMEDLIAGEVKGKAKSKAEGAVEGKVDVAKNMLANNMTVYILYFNEASRFKLLF